MSLNTNRFVPYSSTVHNNHTFAPKIFISCRNKVVVYLNRNIYDITSFICKQLFSMNKEFDDYCCTMQEPPIEEAGPSTSADKKEEVLIINL